MYWFRLLYAFAMGVVEHRSDLTLHFEDDYADAYDRGRYLAWKVTGWNDEAWDQTWLTGEPVGTVG